MVEDNWAAFRLAVKERPDKRMLVMNSRLWNHYPGEYEFVLANSIVLTVARASTINESNEHASTSKPSCSLIGMRMACEVGRTESYLSSKV